MSSAKQTHPRENTSASALSSAATRWVILAAACVVGFIVVYVIAVLTVWGQEWENAAIAGSGQVLPWEATDADDNLDLIQTWSLAIAVLVVGIIGFARRGERPLLLRHIP